MSKYRILEYIDSDAQALAIMWRKSSEGWNGEFADETEESTRMREEGNHNLHTFIAKVDDEIVGYCGLGIYQNNAKKMYIPLLNVRYDYHGNGIGKALLLKAIETTKALGYDYLDLHTWPGNTKSVPLYKKCGFSYANLTDRTQLMNFIPMFLNSPLLKGYFEYFDWYEDRVMSIDMNHDECNSGITKVFKYIFEKNGERLEIHVDTKAMKVCYVDTKDFTIQLSNDYKHVVKESTYQANLNIVCKNGNCDIGVHSKNTRHSRHTFEHRENNDKLSLKANYTVTNKDVYSMSDSDKPSVNYLLTIDGRTLEVATAIEVKEAFAINVETALEKKQYLNGETIRFSVTNNLPTACRVSIALPKGETFTFDEEHLDVFIESNEEIVVDAVIYTRKSLLDIQFLEVHYENQDGVSGDVAVKVIMPLLRNSGKGFGKISNNRYLLVNDTSSVIVTEYGSCIASKDGTIDVETAFSSIELSDTFDTILKTRQAEFKTEVIDDDIVLTASYPQDKYPGITIAREITLSSNGIVKQVFHADNQTRSDFVFRTYVLAFIRNGFYPYKGRIVQNKYGEVVHTHSLKPACWDEPWMMNESESMKCALWIDKNADYNFLNSCISLTYTIPAKERIVTEPSYMAMDVFNTPHELRSYLFNDPQERQIVDIIDVSVNKGNPIFTDRCPITLDSYRELPSDVKSVIVDGKREMQERSIIDYMNTEDIGAITESGLSTFTSNVKYGSKEFRQLSMVMKSEGNIDFSVIEGSNVCDNGRITFKVSENFGPSIYSLLVDGEEMLSSSFPTPKPFCWFNPWLGGIDFQGLVGNTELLDQTIRVETMSVIDQFNETWSGFDIQMMLDTKEYKDVILHCYALTRPGIPCLALQYGIENKTSMYKRSCDLIASMFLDVNGIEDKQYISLNQYGKAMMLYPGGASEYIKKGNILRFSSGSMETVGHWVCQKDKRLLECGVSKEFAYAEVDYTLDIKAHKTSRTGISYLLFHDQPIEEEALELLRALRFSHNN